MKGVFEDFGIKEENAIWRQHYEYRRPGEDRVSRLFYPQSEWLGRNWRCEHWWRLWTTFQEFELNGSITSDR